MSAGRLGSGCSTLLLTPRGGGPAVADLGAVGMTWGRKLNNLSNLTATITDLSGPALTTVDAWTHEAQAWHDGVLAWCGPTWEPSFSETDISLPARDLFQWFERRFLPRDRLVQIDLGSIFALFARDALALDPSPNIHVHASTVGTQGKRDVKAAEYKRAADQLRELSRSGVDWTMVARDLLTGDVQDAGLAADLPVMLDNMILSPRLVKKGGEAASEWVTVGGKDPRTGQQIIGRAHNTGPATGLLQNSSSESDILDLESANNNARTQLDSRLTVPRELTGTLTPDAPAMSQLVPGCRWPVEISVGCLEVSEVMLLTDVRVSQSVSDTGVTNTVSVTLVSLERDAVIDVGEEGS